MVTTKLSRQTIWSNHCCAWFLIYNNTKGLSLQFPNELWDDMSFKLLSRCLLGRAILGAGVADKGAREANGPYKPRGKYIPIRSPIIDSPVQEAVNWSSSPY